jgi:hypothetical protein
LHRSQNTTELAALGFYTEVSRLRHFYGVTLLIVYKANSFQGDLKIWLKSTLSNGSIKIHTAAHFL